MAKGSPVSTAGAHLNADLHRHVIEVALTLPPPSGLLPGRIQGVIEVIEDGVRSSMPVDESKLSGVVDQASSGLTGELGVQGSPGGCLWNLGERSAIRW